MSIAEQIFDILKKYNPELKRKGIYAGQAVATAYQQIIGSEIKGKINDIDQFFIFSRTSEYYKESVGENNGSVDEEKGEEKIPYLLVGEEDYSYDHYNYVAHFFLSKGSYVINKSIRKDNLNIILGFSDSLSYEENTVDKVKYLVNGFDLNCVRCGITFDKDDNAVFYAAPDYLEFLKTKEVSIQSFFSFMNSVFRGIRKSKEMGCYFKKDAYIKALEHFAISEEEISGGKIMIDGQCPIYVIKKNKDEIKAQLSEETLNKETSYIFYEYKNNLISMSINDVIRFIENGRENDIKVKTSYTISLGSLKTSVIDTKIMLQKEFGIPYGLRNNDIKKIEDYGYILCISNEELKVKGLSMKDISRKQRFLNDHNISSITDLPNNINTHDYIYRHKNDMDFIGTIEVVMDRMMKRELNSAHILKEQRKVINLVSNRKFKEADKIIVKIKQIMEKSIRDAQIFPKTQTIIGRTVRLLDTKEELIEQGKKENNCVGGYFGSVVKGGSIIFSIEKDGENTSTLELKKGYNREFNEFYYYLKQLYSKRNQKKYDHQHEIIAEVLCRMANEKTIFRENKLAEVIKLETEKYNNKINNMSNMQQQANLSQNWNHNQFELDEVPF